jgi:hypothetical protein
VHQKFIEDQKAIIDFLTAQNRELMMQNAVLHQEVQVAFEAGYRHGLSDARQRRVLKAV